MADKCGQKECCGFFIMFLVLAAVLVLTISVLSNASQEEDSPVNVDENLSVNPGVYVGLAIILGVFVFITVVCLCVLLFKQGKEALPACKPNFQFLEEKIKQVLKPSKYTATHTDTINQPLTTQPVNADHKLNDASKDCCIVNLDHKCTKTKSGSK